MAPLPSVFSWLVMRSMSILHSCGEPARLVDPPRGLPIILNDPDDDPIIYTALEAGANILCTRDRAFYADHVRAFCRRCGIEVMDDLQLLSLLSRAAM
jgi:hypothetical protein